MHLTNVKIKNNIVWEKLDRCHQVLKLRRNNIAFKQADGSEPWTVAELWWMLWLCCDLSSLTPDPHPTSVVLLAEQILSSLQSIRTATDGIWVVPGETRPTVKCMLTLKIFWKARFLIIWTFICLFRSP